MGMLLLLLQFHMLIPFGGGWPIKGVWHIAQIEIRRTEHIGFFHSSLKPNWSHLMTVDFSRKSVTHVVEDASGKQISLKKETELRPLFRRYSISIDETRAVVRFDSLDKEISLHYQLDDDGSINFKSCKERERFEIEFSANGEKMIWLAKSGSKAEGQTTIVTLHFQKVRNTPYESVDRPYSGYCRFFSTQLNVDIP